MRFGAYLRNCDSGIEKKKLVTMKLIKEDEVGAGESKRRSKTSKYIDKAQNNNQSRASVLCLRVSYASWKEHEREMQSSTSCLREFESNTNLQMNIKSKLILFVLAFKSPSPSC
jgi:hypothetical protein